MEGHCKDCVFWVNGFVSSLTPFGWCKMAQYAGEDGIIPGKKQRNDTLAYAVCQSGEHSATLRTHPLFGCHQFKRREGEE